LILWLTGWTFQQNNGDLDTKWKTSLKRYIIRKRYTGNKGVIIGGCWKGIIIPNTTRNVAICDDLLVTPLTFVIEWYVICDEISIFVIGAK
jgi:hypothetical protein